VPEVRLLPGREFPMTEAARTAFRARWREKLEGDPTRARIYKDMARHRQRRHRVLPAAVLRRSRRRSSTTWATRPGLVLHGKVDEALEHFWVDTRERHRFLQHDPERPILPPAAIFMPAEEFFARTQPHATLSMRGSEPTDWARPLPDLSIDRGATEPLGTLQRHLASHAAPPAGGGRERRPARKPDRAAARPPDQRAQRRHAGGFLAGPEKVAITAAPLAEGFFWHEPGRAASPCSSSPRPSSSPPRRRRGGGASRSRSAASTR
jgi:transcription-repair coupling factor (superfamily II helicase)